MKKIEPIMVEGACPHCGGTVLRNYKGYRGFQKCANLACHKISWAGQRREYVVVESLKMRLG